MALGYYRIVKEYNTCDRQFIFFQCLLRQINYKLHLFVYSHNPKSSFFTTDHTLGYFRLVSLILSPTASRDHAKNRENAFRKSIAQNLWENKKNMSVLRCPANIPKADQFISTSKYSSKIPEISASPWHAKTFKKSSVEAFRYRYWLQ